MKCIRLSKVAAVTLIVVLTTCASSFIIRQPEQPCNSGCYSNQTNTSSLDEGPVFSDWTLPEEVQFYEQVVSEVYVSVFDPDGIDYVGLHYFSPLNNCWFMPRMYYMYTDEEGRSLYYDLPWIRALANGTPLNYIFCFEGNDTLGNWGSSDNITVTIRRGITEDPMFISWDVPRGGVGYLTVTGPFHEDVRVQIHDPDGIDCVNVSVLSPWTHNWTCYQMEHDYNRPEEENWFLTQVDILVNWTGAQTYYTYRFGANDTLGHRALSQKIISAVGMSMIDTIAATNGYFAAMVLGGTALCAFAVALVCLLLKKERSSSVS